MAVNCGGRAVNRQFRKPGWCCHDCHAFEAGSHRLRQSHLAAPQLIRREDDLRLAGVADVADNVPFTNRVHSCQQRGAELRAGCEALPLRVQNFRHGAPANRQLMDLGGVTGRAREGNSYR